jgi:hypothetical protein
MKRKLITAAVVALVCSTALLSGFKLAPVTAKVNTAMHAISLQSTERPLDVTITHVHEGKQVRVSSIHNTIVGSRLTFVYHDGARIVLNFVKPIRVGNYEIRDRTSELQATYYPAGGYPVVMLGYVTIYTLKPITGRVVQLYDAEHEIHISSSSIFAF